MAFSYETPVIVNSGQVPSTQTNFVMLFNTTDNRFKSQANGGHVQSSSGFDIQPFLDSKLTNALYYELERYNASTGEVIMWILVPSISVGTTIFLGYGDPSIGADGSNRTATFSNGFLAV